MLQSIGAHSGEELGSCQWSEDLSHNSILLQFGITETHNTVMHWTKADTGHPMQTWSFGAVVWLLRWFFCSFKLAAVCAGVVERTCVMSSWLEAECGRKIEAGAEFSQGVSQRHLQRHQKSKIFHKLCYCGKKCFSLSTFKLQIDENLI